VVTKLDIVDVPANATCLNGNHTLPVL